MTPEEKRIAIAEACGWTCFKEEIKPAITYLWACPLGVEGDFDIVPDYINDLNAMHEAEKVLTEEQWGPYCVTLNKIACRIPCGNTHTCGYTIAATAAQRADAFLMTIGELK